MPGGGGVVFSNWDASAQGQTIGFRNLSDSRMYHPVASELTTSGSQQPAYIELGVEEVQFTQALTDVTIAATASQYQFSNENQMEGTATLYVITRPPGAATASNCNLIIRLNSHTDANPLVDYKRDHPQGLGFDLVAGDTVITLPVPAFFAENTINYTTIISDDGDNLNILGSNLDLGDGAQDIPAGSITGRAGVGVVLARQDELPTEAQVSQFAANTLIDGTHQGITVTEDVVDGKTVVNLEVTGMQPPVTPSGSVSNYSIDVPSVVPLNGTINGAHMVTFTTTNTDDIASLTLTGIGDDVALTVPASDGTHTVDVTITNAPTNVATTYTSQITGVRDGGQAIMSNIQTTTVRDTQEHEMIYIWSASTLNYATQDLTDAAVESFDVSQPGSSFSVRLSGITNGDYILIMSPSDRPVASILEEPRNEESLDEFTAASGVRTIGATSFNGLSDQNNSGVTISFNATITVGGNS